MKTAMQVVIEKMNEAKENLPPFGFHDEFLRGFNKAFQMAIVIAEKNGLEEEKKQLIEAYNEGKGAVKCNSDESSEDFYNRTFEC